MKKKASIGFTIIIALIIVCCGAAVLSIASGSKYNAKTEYQKIEDRYISESGVDLSVGLFLNYLSNKNIVLAYTKNEDGEYGVIDDYSPYLLEEIRTSEDVDVVPVDEAMISGVVTSTTFKGDYYEIIVEIKGFKWMIESTHNQIVGSTIGLNIIPDAIHIMKKSKYSGKFGDYSSFSDEMDYISDADTAEEF